MTTHASFVFIFIAGIDSAFHVTMSFAFTDTILGTQQCVLLEVLSGLHTIQRITQTWNLLLVIWEGQCLSLIHISMDQTLQTLNKGNIRVPRQHGNKGLIDRRAIAPFSEKQRNVRRWGTPGYAQRPTRVWHLPKELVERVVTTWTTNQETDDQKSIRWKEVMNLSTTAVGVDVRKLHCSSWWLIKTVYEDAELSSNCLLYTSRCV